MELTEKDKSMLLGKNSYSTVVKEIVEKIQQAKADTLAGNELLKEVYSKLNESITPLLTLKPFITGAEKIAGDDVKLGDLLKFLKKSITGNADLNYLINLCKEEHFAEMTRLNHPSPESTIKNIEEEFNQPSSVIEQGIKAGIFDNLKSNLLNKIKSDLVITPDKKLNENALFSGNLVKYSPIGIRLEDLENNRMVVLTESEVLSFDRINKNFSKLDESINIPVNHAKLMKALNSCIYSPENNTFSLNENWDFKLLLNNNGNITINGNDIPKEKISKLLLESVKVYANDPTKVENFNKMNYLIDADNFIALMENYKQLVKLDTLEVIKNLNESTYVIFDKKEIYENNIPKIISSSKNLPTQLFESYSDMLQHINESIFTDKISDLFESQLNYEQNLINNKNEKIVSLNEEQKILNTNIIKVKNLKTIAEENSPAMDKLNEQEKELNNKLELNIFDLNHFENEFKLR